MSSKVHCYLRTQRREWGLTQEEVASLLPKGSRNRVSRVERGLVPPNAQEILAYRLIFGSSVPVLFPRFHTQTVDVVIQRAYRLHNRVRGKSTLADQRKHKLTELMLARATGKAKPQKV